MPGPVPDNVRQRGTHLVGSDWTGHIHPEIAAALREDAPPAVVTGDPVLVGNERWIVDLQGIICPKRDRKIVRVSEFQITRITKRGVIKAGTVLRGGELESLSDLSGRECGRTDRGCVVGPSRRIGVVAVKWQVHDQVVGDRRRKDRQPGNCARDPSVGVCDNHSVFARVT